MIPAMRMLIVLAALLGTLVPVSVDCQTPPAGDQQARVKELLLAAEEGSEDAILQLGLLGDLSVIPFLQKIAAGNETGFATAPTKARMALARLGDATQFQLIVAEIKNADPAIRFEAVQKLAYIDGKEVWGVLVGLLDDVESHLGNDPPDAAGAATSTDISVVMYVPLSYSAMRALRDIAPDPPVSRTEEPKRSHIPLWKEWWINVGSKR